MDYQHILTLDGHSESQKAKCRYFLKKLQDKRFLSFMLYMNDVLETVAIFSKVSQTRGLSISEMEDVLTTTTVKVDEYINDPNRGKLWKSRSKCNIQAIDEISCEYRRNFANAIKTNF